MFKTEFENLRRTCPLIHNITNYVTVNDCANMVLACGASPIMADDAAEVEDITTICGGLNINIGTLNSRTITSMLLAGKKANQLGHPVVLDPVGAGASRLRTDTAFRLLTSTGKGSFYNMKKQGATTIWENWDGERSHSHPMFGAVTRYLFSFILGITQEKNSAGYEKIVIAPQIPDGLNRASGHITTVRGKIAVSFIRTEREMDFYVTVPQKAWFTYGSDCEYELWEGENHIHIDFEE